MTRLGIRHLSFTRGDEKVWYRDLPDIEARIRTLDIPDDEELWEWGYCRRSTSDFNAHVANGFDEVTQYVRSAGITVDAVLAGGLSQGNTDLFVERLTADVVPHIDGAAGRLRRIDDRNCANVLQAIADSRDLIAGGAQNVVVLATEKIENELVRFRSFAVFSDFTLGLVLSSDIASCDYEILDVVMGWDEDSSKDTSRIFARTLEKEIAATLLSRNGLAAADVTKFFYMNLFEPIAEMKTRESGFTRRHFYTEAKESGHCFGADPFMNMHGYFSSGGSGDLNVICASGLGYGGIALVRRLR